MSALRRQSLGSFGGRKVAVVGMGKSNQALVRYLSREGAEITCFDRKTREEMGSSYTEMSRLGVRWSLGPDYLSTLPGFGWVFLTPGMKKNQPAIIEAHKNGAVISSEIDLFMDRCKCEIAAVTGSAGKTTTCTLAGMMLKESLPDREVHVGGNIGSVLIERVDDIPEDAVVVLELSSFQLELVTGSPHVAMILNIRPNHLDIHDNYEDYVTAKKRVYRFQGREDWCFLNYDDRVTRDLAGECPGGVGYFAGSVQGLSSAACEAGTAPSHPVAWADATSLYLEPGPLVGLSKTSPAWAKERAGSRKIAERSDFLVPGEHNVSNALAAALVATAMGATPIGIGSAIKSFRGVEHRIEFVSELCGVRYFNDSIATSPDRTMALLDAIPGPLVLILGGYDKGLPFDELARKVAARGCPVITLGNTAEKIEVALAIAWANLRTAPAEGAPTTSLVRCPGRRPGGPDVQRAGSLDEAVMLATAKARERSTVSAAENAGEGGARDVGRSYPRGEGWSVALSPACASFDMFTSFEERGRLFKEAVRRLK